jgi:hypothetical protein
MTSEELQTWAQEHVFESPEQMSRLIFKEVLPKVKSEEGPFKFGPNNETGAYDITLGTFKVSVPAKHSPV